MKNDQMLAQCGFVDEHNVAISESEFVRRLTGSETRISEISRNLTDLKSKIDGAYNKVKSLSDKDSEVNVHQIKVVPGKVFGVDEEKTIGRIRDYLIRANEAVLGIVGAQRDAEMVVTNILKYQQELADEMKYIFGIGMVNLHQCRFVSKSITLRLHRASDGELDEAEKECLINVLQGLRKQEEYFKTISGLSDDISENRERVDTAITRIDCINDLDEKQEKELARQRDVDKKHDAALAEREERDKVHDKRLDDQQSKLDDLLKRIESLDKKLKEELLRQEDELVRDVGQKHKALLARQEERDTNYGNRLDSQEAKLADLSKRIESFEQDRSLILIKIAVCASLIIAVGAIILSFSR